MFANSTSNITSPCSSNKKLKIDEFKWKRLNEEKDIENVEYTNSFSVNLNLENIKSSDNGTYICYFVQNSSIFSKTDLIVQCK